MMMMMMEASQRWRRAPGAPGAPGGGQRVRRRGAAAIAKSPRAAPLPPIRPKAPTAPTYRLPTARSTHLGGHPPPSETRAPSLPLPATYKQLVAAEAGASFGDVAKVVTLSLDELVASLAVDEVIVRVAYAGVNGGCETFRCRGEHAFARNKSLTNFPLGAEGVGTVVAVGGDAASAEISMHTPVMFVGGAFSEYVKLKTTACTPVPSASTEYAALRISGHVAYSALTYNANIRPGDAVLVTAGAGATGSFAVQVAKRRGAHVVATCRNAAKADVLRRLGVDRVIDYSKEDVREIFEREYRGLVDVVYEGVGGRLLEAAWDVALKDGGRLLSVGYISQYPHNSEEVVEAERRRNEAIDLPASDNLFWKAMRMDVGGKTFVGNVWPDAADVRQRALEEAVALVERGDLECIVDPRRFVGVEAAAEAVEFMLGGDAIGKVVVVLPTG